MIRSPQEIQDFLNRHKVDLEAPHIYYGNEANSFHKDWDKAQLRILFAALWRYEDFRGNQTIPLLYQMINEWGGETVLCERAHIPNLEKDYQLFRKYKIPIFGLESKRSMAEYDIVMTSLSFVPPWYNFPLMLRMSGIDPRWKNRKEEDPIIMVGGSMMYGNFAPAYPVADIIYLGDAEEDDEGGLFSILDFILRSKDEDKLYPHSLTVELIQTRCNYVFVPRCYTPIYEGQKFIKWEHDDRVPDKLKRKICKNLDTAPKYTKPLVSYTDTTMGLGEVEISRGCRGMCSFCGIGWKYRPYRERSVDVMVDAMTENRKNGGGVSLCPIATEFAYYSRKRELIAKLCQRSRYVDPLSMRIDAFIQDEEFDRLLSNTGMNQLSLGVEAVSQRLRNKLMKGVTEEDILEACRIAISSGKFRRIKFFMISNIGEEWDDFEEFFTLLGKVNQMKSHYGSKIEVKASWTPLFVEPCTPLQWMKPTIEQRKDWKTVDKRLRALNVEFALGIKNNEDFLWTTQMLHVGDTRVAEAVIDSTLELDRPFYVAFGHKTKSNLSAMLLDQGLQFSDFIREKDENEEFLWDIVDRGVPKSTLLRVYKKIKSGEAEKKPVKIRSVQYPYDLPTVSALSTEQIPGTWYLVSYVIQDDSLDCVPNTYWKAYLHRAAYLSGFPLAVNQIHFFSDRAGRNWYRGIDYVALAVKPGPFATSDQWEVLNSFLKDIKIVAWYRLDSVERGMWSDVVSHYGITTDIPWSEWELYKKVFENSTSVEVKGRETRYFSGEWRKPVDLKKIFVKYRDIEVVSPFASFELWLGHQIGVRHALPGLFPSFYLCRLLTYDVKKIGLCKVDLKSGLIKESLLEPVFNEGTMGSSPTSQKIL